MTAQYLPIVIIVVVLGVLALIAAARRAATPALPYRKTRSLLTPAERAFYEVLRDAVDDDTALFCKVRLIDLLYLPPGTPDRQEHLNRVLAKHIDFVLCDSHTVAPILAIELDDSSHLAPSRQRRDAFVDDVLRAAGLPLLRVPVRRTYARAEIHALIQRALTGERTA